MKMNQKHGCLRALAGAAAIFLAVALPGVTRAESSSAESLTSTPIKHLVVIFQENVSFDHYFGTYPHAKANQDGTIYFGSAKDDTPRANTLLSSGLLEHNPSGPPPLVLST